MPEATIRSWPVIEGIPLGDEPVLAANAYLGAWPIAQSLGSAPTSSSSAAARIRRSRSVRSSTNSAGARTTGTASLRARSPATCSSAAPRSRGGYFADPGFKDVPGLGEIGYPIAEVGADGTIVITKADGTGGLVSERTVKEQLLYELHDPSAYLVPDVTLDVTAVEVAAEAGPNRVRVTGARGRERPPTLKVTVSAEHGYLAEGEMTYSGMGALARAELAAEVLRDRLRITGLDACRVRIDLIGTVSTFDSDAGAATGGRRRHLPARRRLPRPARRPGARSSDRAGAGERGDRALQQRARAVAAARAARSRRASAPRRRSSRATSSERTSGCSQA